MSAAPVAMIMGSRSDWETMQHACTLLDEFGVGWHAEIVSAHRTPERLFEFGRNAHHQGFRVLIAGAGGAAHLPGMLASLTPLPVLGVPVKSSSFNGVDSMLSIVQMPRGVAVGTLAVGTTGAHNAGLLAAQTLAASDEHLRERIARWKALQADQVLAHPDPRQPES
jgi:5-(carboxyamino)imidazole ribonucleotide mutase